MDINIVYRRRLQVADYEPVEYGVAITDSVQPGETPQAAAARVQAFAGDLFNQIEGAVLADHDVVDRAVPLSLMEGVADSAAGGQSRPTPPKRKGK